MDRAKVKEHLAKAERHVRTGEELIRRQEERIAELGADGHDTGLAEKHLTCLQQLERTMKINRDLVRKELKGSFGEKRVRTRVLKLRLAQTRRHVITPGLGAKP